MLRYTEEKEIINFYQGLINCKFEEDFVWGLWDSHVDMIDRRSKYPNRYLEYTLYRYGRMFLSKLDDCRKNMVVNLITIKSDEHFKYACEHEHSILTNCVNKYGRRYIADNQNKFMSTGIELSTLEKYMLRIIYLRLIDNKKDIAHIMYKSFIKDVFEYHNVELPVEEKSEVVEFNNNK